MASPQSQLLLLLLLLDSVVPGVNTRGEKRATLALDGKATLSNLDSAKSPESIWHSGSQDRSGKGAHASSKALKFKGGGKNGPGLRLTSLDTVCKARIQRIGRTTPARQLSVFSGQNQGKRKIEAEPGAIQAPGSRTILKNSSCYASGRVESIRISRRGADAVLVRSRYREEQNLQANTTVKGGTSTVRKADVRSNRLWEAFYKELLDFKAEHGHTKLTGTRGSTSPCLDESQNSVAAGAHCCWSSYTHNM